MKYRIGWPHAAVKSPWTDTMLAADPHGQIIVGPCATFAFGRAMAFCPDPWTAERVVKALTLLDAVEGVMARKE